MKRCWEYLPEIPAPPLDLQLLKQLATEPPQEIADTIDPSTADALEDEVDGVQDEDEQKKLNGLTINQFDNEGTRTTNQSKNTPKEEQMTWLSEKQFKVKQILAKRAIRRKNKINIEYLIKWKDYPTANNLWEPEEYIMECDDLLRDYENKH